MLSGSVCNVSHLCDGAKGKSAIVWQQDPVSWTDCPGTGHVGAAALAYPLGDGHEVASRRLQWPLGTLQM